MEEPPSYAAASTANPRTQLQSGELVTFTLDNTLIFPSAPPSVALYELGIGRINKLRYRLGREGEHHYTRSEIMYQTIPSRIPHYLYIGGRTRLMIFGKMDRRSTYESATMEPGRSSGNWKIPGFFRTKSSLLDRNLEGAEIQWLDWESGHLVALETRSGKGQGQGEGHLLPSLELKVDLGEKRRDLLVACWIARLMREAL